MHSTTILDNVGLATIIVLLLQWAKRTRMVPWLNQHSDIANRIASLVAAFCASAGLKIASSGSFEHGGQIVLMFPPLTEIVDAIVHFAGQSGLQEMVYRMGVKPITKPSEAPGEARVAAKGA